MGRTVSGPSEILEEECGYAGLGDVYASNGRTREQMENREQEIVEFVECAKDITLMDEDRDRFVIGEVDVGETQMPYPDSRRGTTGQRVKRNTTKIVVEDGEVVMERGTDIQSDPALGPRWEVDEEIDTNSYEVAGKYVKHREDDGGLNYV